MGVARIPLLDFDLLHQEVERIRPTLSPEVLARDEMGTTRLFIRSDHKVIKQQSHQPTKEHGEEGEMAKQKEMIVMKPGRSAIAGMISPSSMSMNNNNNYYYYYLPSI